MRDRELAGNARDITFREGISLAHAAVIDYSARRSGTGKVAPEAARYRDRQIKAFVFKELFCVASAGFCPKTGARRPGGHRFPYNGGRLFTNCLPWCFSLSFHDLVPSLSTCTTLGLRPDCARGRLRAARFRPDVA